MEQDTQAIKPVASTIGSHQSQRRNRLAAPAELHRTSRSVARLRRYLRRAGSDRWRSATATVVPADHVLPAGQCRRRDAHQLRGRKGGWRRQIDPDEFDLNSVRLYVNGSVTNNIKFTFNTEYTGDTGGSDANKVEVLDAIARLNMATSSNIWARRFLPPSDRANLRMARTTRMNGPRTSMACRTAMPAWQWAGITVPRTGASSSGDHAQASSGGGDSPCPPHSVPATSSGPSA